VKGKQHGSAGCPNFIATNYKDKRSTNHLQQTSLFFTALLVSGTWFG